MKTSVNASAAIFVRIVKWFVSSAFILWGWNVIAPHLNAPLFTYWEIFAMRMALTNVMGILWQRPNPPIEKAEEEEE